MGLPIYGLLGIVSAEIFWTMIETTIALIAVCLPAIKKVLLLEFYGKVRSLSSLGRYFRSITPSLSGGGNSSLNKSMIRVPEYKDIELSNVVSNSTSTSSLVNDWQKGDKIVVLSKIEDLDPRFDSRTGHHSKVEVENRKGVVREAAIYRVTR
jgi:hypothetical protein